MSVFKSCDIVYSQINDYAMFIIYRDDYHYLVIDLYYYTAINVVPTFYIENNYKLYTDIFQGIDI